MIAKLFKAAVIVLLFTACQESKVKDPAVQQAEDKVTDMLKTNLERNNYGEILGRYEKLLLDNGVLSADNADGYKKMLQETGASNSMQAIPSFKASEGWTEADDFNRRGIATSFNAVPGITEELPENTSLKRFESFVFYIQGKEETKPMGNGPVLLRLGNSISDEDMDEQFYQDLVLLMLLAMKP